MKVVIDTNSMLSLVRYYLPFDKNHVLFEFIQDRLLAGEMLLIDEVLEQCKYNSKGLVIETLEFLKDPDFLKSASLPIKTEFLIPPQPARFLRMVENQFANLGLVHQMGLTETEFENRKDDFMKGADARQIILCMNLLKDGEEVVLVTEETERSNDNKVFKKIPAICNMLGILTMTLPELLYHYQIDLDFRQNGSASKTAIRICEKCQHFIPVLNSCNAFPDGIPMIIIESNRHDKPVDGQKNSLVFTPNKN